MTGKILKGIGGFYYVKCPDGLIYECRARGKFRKNDIKPIIGDCVDIEPTGEENKGYVVKIHSRKNSFIRPPVANIDLMVIVVSLKNPSPDTMFIDKMLAVLKSCNTEAVLCFNKNDIAEDEDKKDILSIYDKTEYKTVFVSAQTGDGIEELKTIMNGKTVAFAGFSGVGKSSLLNAVTDLGYAQVGNVSEKLKRGKHTTRHVEIFEAVDFSKPTYIVDTPGFSMLELPESIEQEDLKDLFSEFIPYEKNCRFTGCIHKTNKFCGVWDEVEKGNISQSRYNNYITLLKELQERKKW